MDAHNKTNRWGFTRREFLAIAGIGAASIAAPSCSPNTDGGNSHSEAASESSESKIHDKTSQEQTTAQDNDIEGSSSGNSYMLSMTGTLSSISDDFATISTDSEEVDVTLSDLKDGSSYPAYISPGIEVVASYFPEDRDSEGRLIIRQIMLKSQYDEIAKRNGR